MSRNPGTSPLSARALSVVGLALGFWALASAPARAQTSLGGQRVGTSSGTFLKITLDARTAALGGAAISVVEGPGAIFINPANILVHNGGTAVYASFLEWPADIHIGAACLSHSMGSSQVAFGLAALGTDFPETNEYYPQGTGRTVQYGDLAVLGTFARHFTDRLAIGITLKYFREDLGSNVGGPTTSGALFDAGSAYSLGYRNGRLCVALSNFGSDLQPSGSYMSHVTDSEVGYASFSPPTQFQLGFAMDPWIAEAHRLTAAVQVLHQSDSEETVRFGAEYWFRESYALRTGYDLASDEMGFSAGLGVKVPLGGRPGTVDYAFTQGGNLADVHRFSLSFAF